MLHYMITLVGEHQRWALPHRCGIDSAKLAKKGAKWRAWNYQKITSAPTKNYFHLNGNIVPFECGMENEELPKITSVPT